MILSTDRWQSGVGRDRRPRKRSDDGPDIIVPILRSGIVAREFCRPGAPADVEAVFERSFYLRFGDMFVCVGEPAVGDGPLTLIADLGVSRALASLGLYPGQPATISDRCITIGDLVQLTFDRCVPWRQPRWPSSRSPCELNDLGSVVARRMALEAPPEGLGRVFCQPEGGAGETPLARIARPRMARFEVMAARRAGNGFRADHRIAGARHGFGRTGSGTDPVRGRCPDRRARAARRARGTEGACGLGACGRRNSARINLCVERMHAEDRGSWSSGRGSRLRRFGGRVGSGR